MLKKIIQQNSIFFIDLDNTLIYTNYANYLAYQQAAKIFGYSISPFCVKERFNRHSLRKKFPKLSSSDYYQIIAIKEQCFSQFLPQTTLNLELLSIIKTYQKHKIYLITNSRKERAFSTLRYHRLLPFFSQIFTLEDFQEKNKYHDTIEKLNIPPNHILLFEDDPQEITYAISSGIYKHHIFSPHFGD